MGAPSILQPALPISPFSDIVINAQPVVLVATHCDRDRAAAEWAKLRIAGGAGVAKALPVNRAFGRCQRNPCTSPRRFYANAGIP